MGKDINNMNLNQIDLNLFTIFDVIYTERNLTKAGKVLGITQPAVSNALSRLRTTFNDNASGQLLMTTYLLALPMA